MTSGFTVCMTRTGYWIMRARLLTGRVLAAQGETNQASAELNAVQADAAHCGARALARQAALERRRLAAWSSRTPPTPGHSNLPPLTGRQTEIAALVAEGLTNRQIARRLNITEKTVEMHLSNMFSKLRVTSRAAVASRFTRATKQKRHS